MRYRFWVIIATGLFVIGMGIGLLISAAMPTAAGEVFSEEISVLEELAALLGPFQATTAIFIFIKNAMAVLVSFALSPILCLLPILALVLNGSLLTFVAGVVVQEESLGFLLAGLLPHGIFEIPAIIMGEAAALGFGATVIMALVSSRRRHLLLPSLKQNLKYLLISLILLVPAAVIETFVTPLLLQ
jgi:stage II sporulation protein M